MRSTVGPDPGASSCGPALTRLLATVLRTAGRSPYEILKGRSSQSVPLHRNAQGVRALLMHVQTALRRYMLASMIADRHAPIANRACRKFGFSADPPSQVAT